MKIRTSPEWNRAMFVDGLPKSIPLHGGKGSCENLHGNSLAITIGYISDSSSPLEKAVLLDNVVIPEIIRRFNGDAPSEMRQALADLLADHRAMCKDLAGLRGLIKPAKEERIHAWVQSILDNSK